MKVIKTTDNAIILLRIFGKPSKIHKTYNPKIDEMLETHVYYISDSLCPDTNARESVNICSYISFIFRKGEQDKKYGRKPWLRLHNEYF